MASCSLLSCLLVKHMYLLGASADPRRYGTVMLLARRAVGEGSADAGVDLVLDHDAALAGVDLVDAALVAAASTSSLRALKSSTANGP